LALAAVLLMALAGGGCSFSYQLGSLFEKGQDDDRNDVTGSIAPASAKLSTALPPDADLAFTRAAVSEVLNRGGKDASLPWENPHTGARGTVTPIATAYTQDGVLCRDFLASYLSAGAEAWLQGEACRVRQGRWDVRSLRPWKRS
jgi:surface antigen